MQPKTNKPTTDFIHNPDFVNWVISPSEESEKYWQSWIINNPLRKSELMEGRTLIEGLVRKEKTLSESEVLSLWNKIEDTRSHKKLRFIKIRRWSAAASILILLGVSGWLVLKLNTSKQKIINYQTLASNVPASNNIELVLADHSQKTFTNKQVEIKYDHSGKLETKAGEETQSEDLQQSTEGLQMNQLFVPRGKRCNLVLADGTKLWLNSGTKAIYPVAFSGKTREIYIEGECYLEVAHDALKPFYVVTDQVKVKVLGTKFDISAYKDDCIAAVVLVEGSIEANDGSENFLLKPNDLLFYQKQTHKVTVEKTNVLPFISWKDGWMLCEKEPIHVLTRKISRYYDLKINFTDPRINNMTLTGKLDLKNNYEDVFKIICATAPLKYEIIGDSIFLTVKEKK